MTITEMLAEWAVGSGPLYRRLALAIRAAIERGDLQPGEVLPAERTLAKTLAVSRTTVVAAYDYLRDESVVESRRGSGTRVAYQPAVTAPRGTDAPALHSMLGGDRSAIHFTAACLPGNDLVTTAIARLSTEELAPHVAGTGYEPAGIALLREAIANYYVQQGLPTDADQIIVTNGAQQALVLLTRLNLGSGERVVLEDPTYPGIIDAIRPTGARMVPVPVGPHGAETTALADAVTRATPALIYLIPTFQSPTGALMPEAVGRQVVKIAAESAVPVIDDRVLANIAFDSTPPPPLAVHDSAGVVITVESASKIFWAGLRIGWVRAPAPVIARLTRLKVVADLGTNIITQLITARMLADVETSRRFIQQDVARRHRILTDLLTESLPDWKWQTPHGGLCLWVKIDGDASQFAQIALRHGVTVVPGPAASPTEGHGDYLRIPFVHGQADMVEGVARLTRAWQAYQRTAETPTAYAPVLV